MCYRERLMTRISLAGCGRWGRNILRDLLALGCVVTVADPDAGAREQAIANGAQDAVIDATDLPESDGVVIATPSSIHAATIDQVLPRGVPVFVEKPMVCSVAGARRLVSQARGRLFVMDKWRYHPGVAELRRIRESGELGRSLGMHLVQVGWGSPHSDVDVTWILLPHCLGILHEVLGCLPPVYTSFAERVGGEAVSLCGVLGGTPWATIEVSARSPEKRREFRLHCEDGVAYLDGRWHDHIRIARAATGPNADGADVERRPVSAELPLLRELRVFVDHLHGGPPPVTGVDEGAIAVERIRQLRTLAGLPE
jgi:predicted dehydrogenase